MKTVILLSFLTLMTACNQGPDPSQGHTTTSTPVSQGVAPLVPSTPYNGTYIFDAEQYKTEQLKHADSIFKKMNSEDLEKMMQVFKPFKIEVTGNSATASFSQEVIKGELKTLKKTSHETHLFMTPVDENKRDQTVTLIIQDNARLVLDPGGKETDKMFFKRVN